MTTRYLITSVATWGATVGSLGNFPGIKNSYDLDQIPEKLSETQLPCLTIVPEVGTEQGFNLLAFMGNSPQTIVEFTHLMLYGTSAVREAKRDLPGLLDAYDAYLAAAKVQKFFDTQAGPPFNQVVINFTVAMGITDWGGTPYHSLAMRHKYTIYG